MQPKDALTNSIKFRLKYSDESTLSEKKKIENVSVYLSKYLKYF